MDSSMNSFAMQLTNIKSDLKNNRTVVANLFKEVEEFHEAQTKVIDEGEKEMQLLSSRRL